jgi:hypothetical protein
VHVVDNAGNWNDERNSNTNGQPSGFEPIYIEVKTAVTAEILSHAPIEEWNRTYGTTQDDRANSVLPTSDGGYILAGYTFSEDTWSRDAWLIKTNSEGNVLWMKTFGRGYIDEARSIQPTNDGGFVLGGVTNSFGDGNAWMIRTDGEGNQIWNRTFGGSNIEEVNFVQQTSDGGYILVGSIEHYLAPGNFYTLFIKADSQGNELWQKAFGGESHYEQIKAVQQISDGGYILAGITKSFGAGSSDAWLIKTDSDGNGLWHKTFGGTTDDWANSVQQTSDGGYILAGVTNHDALLIKTDSEGNKLWERTFDDPEANEDWVYSVQQTSDGGYILAGVTNGYYDYWENGS